MADFNGDAGNNVFTGGAVRYARSGHAARGARFYRGVSRRLAGSHVMQGHPA